MCDDVRVEPRDDAVPVARRGREGAGPTSHGTVHLDLPCCCRPLVVRVWLGEPLVVRITRKVPSDYSPIVRRQDSLSRVNYSTALTLYPRRGFPRAPSPSRGTFRPPLWASGEGPGGSRGCPRTARTRTRWPGVARDIKCLTPRGGGQIIITQYLACENRRQLSILVFALAPGARRGPCGAAIGIALPHVVRYRVGTFAMTTLVRPSAT